MIPVRVGFPGPASFKTLLNFGLMSGVGNSINFLKKNRFHAVKDISFDMTRPHVDYWEKVDGKWAITVLTDSSSISGGMSTLYFIPNNNDAWEKKDYVHIDSDSLLAMPDPDRHALK